MQYRWRRIIVVLGAAAAAIGLVISNPNSYEAVVENANAEAVVQNSENNELAALNVLEKLEVKGRAPKTGYDREQFYRSWPKIDGCNLRQRIIKRELGETAKLDTDNCTVLSGEFDEPYTGQHLIFYQKSDLSSGVQIDHVVALSDAWQKGAQQLTSDERYNLATDPLNLLAVESSANQQKSDGDAATWLPKNKSFRCEYVARQVSVKYKYSLWVTQAEHDAIERVLQTCPNEPALGLNNFISVRQRLRPDKYLDEYCLHCAFSCHLWWRS